MTETKQDATLGDTRMYWLHAQAPLHVGAGRGIGFIDLPIAREVVTNWPFVPGSAVKGVLADHYGVTDDSRKSDKLHYQAFGRADADGESSNSGSLVFTDAHLVCLPVRSLYGTFAWCSSPIALERLKRDLSRSKAGQNLPSLSLSPGANSALQIHVTSATQSVLVEAATQANQLGRAYFEDLDFDAVSCTNADLWATALAEWVFEPGPWRKLFCERFAVVPDDVFSFLCETATQVTRASRSMTTQRPSPTDSSGMKNRCHRSRFSLVLPGVGQFLAMTNETIRGDAVSWSNSSVPILARYNSAARRPWDAGKSACRSARRLYRPRRLWKMEPSYDHTNHPTTADGGTSIRCREQR